jgi:methyl-accepting chemotaxis protein
LTKIGESFINNPLLVSFNQGGFFMFNQFIDTIFGLNSVGLIIVALIITLLTLAFTINIFLVAGYNKILKDLKITANREGRLFEHQLLNRIVSDYTKASKEHSGEVNTQALIEKHFDGELRISQLGERFVKTSVSLMIILGLVGTFFGLTMSIGQLVTLLAEDVENALSIDASITTSLISAMSGMSVAFVTSLFGISASIVMTIFNLFFNSTQRRLNLMVNVEEYLDNDVYKDIRSNKLLSGVTTNGETLSFKGSDPITVEAMKVLTDTLVDRLYGVTGAMATSVEALQATVTQFDTSLTTFAESARDFKEFNHHMKDNVQRMSLGFSDFTQEMAHQTERIANGYDSVNDLTKTLKELSKDE